LRTFYRLKLLRSTAGQSFCYFSGGPKYPVMFREADCVLITKTDLLPYLQVDIERIEAHIHAVNPHATVIRVSASSGEGLAPWHGWVHQQAAAVSAAQAPALALA
jgi:hydrogenase nickel incorporation protein HypB